MPSLLNVVPGAVGQAGASIIYGQVVSPAPNSVSDPLNVVMPDWSVDFPFSFQDWPMCHGATIPAVGSDVLLVSDNRGTRRVIWWEGLQDTDMAVTREAPLNVKWAEFGAPGIAGQDSAAGVNAAVAKAAGASGSTSLNVSGAGEIYLPPGVYDMISQDGIQTTSPPVGLTIKGAGPQATMIRSKASGAPIAINIDGGASSGSANKVAIRDLMVMYQAGSSGATAIRLWDVLYFQISNCEIYANGIGVNVQGTGMGSIRDSQIYISGPTAGPVASLWVGNGSSSPNAGNGTLTYSGPITVDNTQLAADSCPTIIVDGCVNFRMVAGQLGNTDSLATVEVDGAFTTATFEDVHSESVWDTTNSGTDYLVGSHSKPAGFRLLNPTMWGQGDGTNWRKEAVSIVGCRNTKVEGALFSKLGSTHGFDSGAIHLLSGCFVAGDVAIFQCNTKDITGPLYQDDNSIVSTSYLGDYIWQHQTVENGT